MALDIFWSPKALENFHDVIYYLQENWTDAIVRDSILKTEKIIDQIARHPHTFRSVSSGSSIREAVITKHNLLLYKIHKNQIVLLAVFDTRQHPRKKKIQ